MVARTYFYSRWRHGRGRPQKGDGQSAQARQLSTLVQTRTLAIERPQFR